ncbi:hypothetical protein RJ640_020193 [Escallonia rubra]|uniref:Uncharacterized protein n=1 Tax=Escallonia rubra TaxID=112253 RepID=A0AA88RE30_9ASTE|nr:hypothetical protein RJ640_020193 [Escallonia rubra]
MNGDGMDAHMMDTDCGGSSRPGQNDAVRGLLALARQLIDQCQPSQALQAIRFLLGGDEAVIQALDRARELHRNKVQASTAADELASLFAECAIAEALPSSSEPAESNMVDQSFESDACVTSILAETGRKQIMLDAFSNGSRNKGVSLDAFVQLLLTKSEELKEYGITESWANLTSVALMFDESNVRLQLSPLAYSRSGDQVLQTHNNTRLHWYDLVKREFRNVKVCGLPSWLYAGVCVESLVSLNGYGEESETDAFFLKNYKLVRPRKAQNVRQHF